MDLDSGLTGLRCTRLLPVEGPSSCSNWLKLVRQLTLWPLIPSPHSMRPAFRDRPNVPGYSWMLALRWVDGGQEILIYFDDMNNVFIMHQCSILQVDARNIDGSTPLCDACAAGSLECVRLLLEYGATVNPPLFTFSPLHEACMSGMCCIWF